MCFTVCWSQCMHICNSWCEQWWRLVRDRHCPQFQCWTHENLAGLTSNPSPTLTHIFHVLHQITSASQFFLANWVISFLAISHVNWFSFSMPWPLAKVTTSVNCSHRPNQVIIQSQITCSPDIKSWHQINPLITPCDWLVNGKAISSISTLAVGWAWPNSTPFIGIDGRLQPLVICPLSILVITGQTLWPRR